MILLIGGTGQGKLAYAIEKTGCGPEDVACDPEAARRKPIFVGLESWIREHPDENLEEKLDTVLEDNPDVVILCDEVGCGVVPIDPGERSWREAVGRLCCVLARRADRVERIFCGLSMVLKGDGAWT